MAVSVAALSNGKTIPVVGLGTWQSNKGGEVKAAVKTALKVGYKHIDCAALYFNEEEVGEAIAESISEGIVKREDIFITSKLWNTEHGNVRAAFLKSLQDLKVDYLDLYLVHWPVTTIATPGNALGVLTQGKALQPPISDTWAEMEKLVDEGLVRSIGVSNFGPKKLADLLSYCRIKPVVNQVEAHPYWRWDELFAFCKTHDIHITAYSPLGTPGSMANMGFGATPEPMKDPLVLAIAEKLGKSPAQVCLRWGVQRGTSVIPKSVHPDRIASNLDVLTWQLSEEDMSALNSLTQTRVINGIFWCQPDGAYTTPEELWE